MILCLLLTAGTTWAVFEFIVWNRLPSELVGKWVVEGGEQNEDTYDFYRDGTMVGHVSNPLGNLGIIKAHVRVEGDKLIIITQSSRGQTAVHTKRIRTLTRTELVLEDGNSQITKMVRAD